MKKFFTGVLVTLIIVGMGLTGHFMYKHHKEHGTVVPESWYNWLIGDKEESVEEQNVEQAVEEEPEESADETSAE